MTIDEQQITEYLRSEAGGVRVHDTLQQIETSAVFVPIATAARRRRRWMPVAATATVAAAVVAGVVVIGNRAEAPAAGTQAAPPPATVPSSTTPPVVQLPDGAVLQGFTPACTTTDGIEYRCVLDGYPAGDDHTDEAQPIVDDTSHVSGGCRSTSADGSTWTCYIGARAVDEQIIGPLFLHEYAPRGFANG
jgi:hypothetical protein